MPIRFSDLGGKVRSVRVKWQDLECNVTYSPSANTTALQLALQQAAADDPVEGTRESIKMLTTILVGWDMMKEQSTNGKEPHADEPEPITEEFLHRLPASFVTAIIEAIADDQSPNRRRSGR
jgi:hypothetical protein